MYSSTVSKPNNYNNQAARSNNTKFEPLDELKYVKEAEEIIVNISYEKNKITSSQIRIILSLINELYDMIRLDTSEKLSTAVQSHIQYIKMKIMYQAGRNSNVKYFVDKSNIANHLDHVGNSRANLLLVCHYMEALVAYHKYYIKDKTGG
ncbi:MAG: type III-A CRISPR-associated protein Csm2 [Acutalibacteraceae bacterium]